MLFSHILSLGGATIGVTTIILGVVGLTTPTWIILTTPGTIQTTYSLFERCNKPYSNLTAPLEGCTNLKDFETAHGLTISGVVIVGLGIIASVLTGIFVKNHWIKWTPQSLLIIGPTLILIGALFYVKNTLTHFSTGTIEMRLGYSFILILVTCIIGYISAAYALLITGFTQGYQHGRLAISPGSQ